MSTRKTWIKLRATDKEKADFVAACKTLGVEQSKVLRDEINRTVAKARGDVEDADT